MKNIEILSNVLFKIQVSPKLKFIEKDSKIDWYELTMIKVMVKENVIGVIFQDGLVRLHLIVNALDRMSRIHIDSVMDNRNNWPWLKVADISVMCSKYIYIIRIQILWQRKSFKFNLTSIIWLGLGICFECT